MSQDGAELRTNLDLIASQPSDEQVYDYLQARINALQARNMSPNTISIYFSHIRQYLRPDPQLKIEPFSSNPYRDVF